MDVNVRNGGTNMKVAVTYEEGRIFQHFGHTKQFKIYYIENEKVVNEEIIDTNGSGHSALAGLLVENNVDILICGGIGGGAQTALRENGIKLYGGVMGMADGAIEALILGKLKYNENVHCQHHDSEHSGKEHKCGEHGCGKHTCH